MLHSFCTVKLNGSHLHPVIFLDIKNQAHRVNPPTVLQLLHIHLRIQKPLIPVKFLQGRYRIGLHVIGDDSAFGQESLDFRIEVIVLAFFHANKSMPCQSGALYDFDLEKNHVANDLCLGDLHICKQLQAPQGFHSARYVRAW